MLPSVLPLEHTLDMNTRLLLNRLHGVDDSMALERSKEGTNHVAFLALHMLDARYFLLRTAGVELDCPFKDLLEGKKGGEDFEAFPALAELRDAWADVSKKLTNRLEELSEQDLEAKPSFEFPIEGGATVLGALTFLTQHDGYHLGQIALHRRYLGLEAMAYK